MQVLSVTISNLRAFENAKLELGPITLLVGPNNSGKSTLIRAVHSLQAGGALDNSEIRFGSSDAATVEIALAGIDMAYWSDWPMDVGIARTDTSRPGMVDISDADTDPTSVRRTLGLFPPLEPDNFIYPYLADRKTSAFEESINDQMTRQVRTDISNLAAKVDRLMDVHHLEHSRFRHLVDEVIGLPLSAISSASGKQVGMWVDRTQWIPLHRMGSGVAQMLGLIVHLCVAEDKLFLIEELENDIHPKALKVLLGVIEERSASNQFVLSTHSNIIVRYLGSVRTTKIYETAVNASSNLPPLATVRPVGNDVRSRTALLSSLGYELSDADLFDGWLILEESSAERIIRDYLIPWFSPSLSRVRTVAARGTSDLASTFDALDKLVLFMNLQKRYEGRVRVIADNDPSGISAAERLRQKYTKDWPGDSFRNFSARDFEEYYPARFAERVHTLAKLDRAQRRESKKQLLRDVLEWIGSSVEAARTEFAVSAADVIAELKDFEDSLLSPSEMV